MRRTWPANGAGEPEPRSGPPTSPMAARPPRSGGPTRFTLRRVRILAVAVAMLFAAGALARSTSPAFGALRTDGATWTKTAIKGDPTPTNTRSPTKTSTPTYTPTPTDTPIPTATATTSPRVSFVSPVYAEGAEGPMGTHVRVSIIPMPSGATPPAYWVVPAVPAGKAPAGGASAGTGARACAASQRIVLTNVKQSDSTLDFDWPAQANQPSPAYWFCYHPAGQAAPIASDSTFTVLGTGPSSITSAAVTFLAAPAPTDQADAGQTDGGSTGNTAATGESLVITGANWLPAQSLLVTIAGSEQAAPSLAHSQGNGDFSLSIPLQAAIAGPLKITVESVPQNSEPAALTSTQRFPVPYGIGVAPRPRPVPRPKPAAAAAATPGWLGGALDVLAMLLLLLAWRAMTPRMAPARGPIALAPAVPPSRARPPSYGAPGMAPGTTWTSGMPPQGATPGATPGAMPVAMPPRAPTMGTGPLYGAEGGPPAPPGRPRQP